MHCTIEGVASIALAVKSHQLSLLLFGLDSKIEVAPNVLIARRLAGKKAARHRERIVTGGVGVLLLLLVCAAVSASIVHLLRRDTPQAAVAGLVISCSSLLTC